MSKCCWKNGADRHAQHRVATNLLVKNAVPPKHDKVKCNKMRLAYNDMINALKKAYNTGVITSEEFWDKLVEIGKDKMSAS